MERHSGSQKHKLKLYPSPIGAGAFGSIYKGVLDGEIVAIKTNTCSSAQDVAKNGPNSSMFFREAQMLRSCAHKRIVGYRSLLRLPSSSKSKPKEAVWALAMEYCTGGNLSQLVVRQMTHPGSKQYSNVQAMGWALDVASALEYLHLRTPAVLHRDVKSANIMLTTEGGSLVAKLSDFGLHVTADRSKYNTLQRCSMNVDSSTQASSLASPAPLDPATVPDTSSDSLAAKQQQDGSTPAVSAAGHADNNTEAQDSAGSLEVVDRHSSSAKDKPGEAQQQHPPSLSGAGSCDKVTQQQQQQQQQPHSRPQHHSFRRASHHPPGYALPRLSPGVEAMLVGSKGGMSDMEAAADANNQLFAHWGTEHSSSAGGVEAMLMGSKAGSVCSMASDCTWATEGMAWRSGSAVSRTDTAGSDGTDDNLWGSHSGVFQEMETVFDMTGNTGSSLYMAPEVCLSQSYNEKSDVFSFGVVLYELMARTLVAFTELPQHSSDPTAADKYAAKVAAGYRPSRPKSLPDDMWALITACWQQDPVLRPHMSEVVAVLSKALADAAAQQLTSRKTRFSLGRRLPPRIESGRQLLQQQPVARCGSAAPPQHDSAADVCGLNMDTRGETDCSNTSSQTQSVSQPPFNSCGCVIC